MTEYRDPAFAKTKVASGSTEHFERGNDYAARAHDLCDHNKRAGNMGGPPPETEEGRRSRLEEARVMATLALAYETYRGRLR